MAYLVISKRNKSKRSEGLGDEDISDLAVLHEELTQIIRGQVLRATANKHLPAPHWLIRTLLLKTTRNMHSKPLTSSNISFDIEKN